ncbi:hypothetical protein JW968_01455 [Candidatus Woesearchaeota archaeon]|nr:hypothetical protein [Candidatus Woesearchaeota archaeon]
MSAISYIGEMLSISGQLFSAPFRFPELLWILVPVYLMWIFTELFQEKKGTSLGNAITNGVVLIWAGVDWLRTLAGTTQWFEKTIYFYAKIGISALIIIYGALVIIFGLKMVKGVKVLGKIRMIAYFIIFFTPVIYGKIDLSLQLGLAVLLFAPIFYLVIGLITRMIPSPKTYEEPILEPSPLDSGPMENLKNVFESK